MDSLAPKTVFYSKGFPRNILSFHDIDNADLLFREFISSPRPHLLSSSTCLPWCDISPLVDWMCSDMVEFLDKDLNEATTHRSTNDFDICEHAALQALKEKESARQQQEYQRQLEEYERNRPCYSSYAEQQRLSRERHNVYENQIRDVRKQISDLRRTSFDTGRLEQDLHRLRIREEDLIEKKDSNMRILTIECPSRPAPPKPSKLDAQIQQLKTKWQEEREMAASKRLIIRELESSAIRSMLSGKMKSRRSSDLKTLLQHSRSCEASDPRDRIYAFLGLAHQDYGIIPNYSFENTVVAALIQAAQQIIKYDKNLDILQHVSRGRDKLGTFLPTWVPDWTSREIISSLETYTSKFVSKGSHVAFNASNGLSAEPAFRYDKSNETNVDLKVKGVVLDHLDELEGPVNQFPDLSRFQTARRCCDNIIAPKYALLDDEVWVLHGSSMPVLLRAEGEDTYALLGEVLLLEDNALTPSPLMFGQLLQGTNISEVETREIWLI